MKIEITIPNNLNEITLGQYQKFLSIAENNKEGEFLNAKMIEIFCGISLADTYNLKMSSVTAILDILNDMLEQKPQHIVQFKMDGVKYGFIPDLDELTLGEYIDLDNNISKWEQIHIAMNVLYRPIKDSKGLNYNTKDYDTSDSDKMKNMPLGAAMGSLFFFYNLGLELSRHTILSSKKQLQTEATQEGQTSLQNGDGINQYMLSLNQILQDLKVSLN
tara:strand:- start:74 stop:727 length:654 start_codon:yes stop_codon:yes gene_type:complete